MIGSTRKVRVWAYAQPADLRKGYNGLYGLVSQELGQDPLSGDCFLFSNRRQTLAKVLMWDGTGLCIYMKRLEKGRFACLWKGTSGESLKLTVSELALFLEGSSILTQKRLSPQEFTPCSLESLSMK
jgi:transposase